MRDALISIEEVQELLLDNGFDVVKPRMITAVEAVVNEVLRRERRKIAFEFFLALSADLEKSTQKETEVASDTFSRTMPRVDRFVLWIGERAGVEELLHKTPQ